MNNQDNEGVQEFHQVLTVDCHDTATDTLVISSDGDLSSISEVNDTNNVETLELSHDGKTIQEQIVFIQQHEERMEQQQQNLQQRNNRITQQSHVEKSSSEPILPNNHHTSPKTLAIRPNISEIARNVLPVSASNSSSSLSNGTINILPNNLSLNLLANSSTSTTTIEQPNNGPCSCFVCGRQLSDPSERFYYLKSQKLFNTQITLLELLSAVMNTTIVTNTGAIDLCSRCSELINDTDSAYTHLNRLKKQISGLFTSNQRPKLTFQVLPKSSNLGPVGINSAPLVSPAPKLNLDDLAATRPRRGRQKKADALKKKHSTLTGADTNIVQVKKKMGRPRKPFSCHICKRKFLTKDMVGSHMFREHDIQPIGLVKPVLGSENVSGSGSGAQGSKLSTQQIKVEPDDSKEKILNCMKTHPLKTEPHVGAFAQLISQSISANSVETGRIIPSSPTKSNTNSVSQFLASMRPIQPKPQTMIQTAPDGSMVLLMKPTIVDSSATVIKVTPGYMNLQPYACDKCKKTFHDEKGRRMHRIAAHGFRKRKRDDEDGDEEDELSDKQEGSESVWQCQLCQTSFNNKKMLMEHRKALHPRCNENGGVGDGKQKIHPCEECDQIFNAKYKLEKHRESHVPYTQMGPHEFVCCVCGLKVASKAALKAHLHRFHYKDEETKDYLCSECGYMASTKKAFTDHQRIHNDDPGPKARCSVCSKEMLASSYKIHMLRMHGEAKHPCDTCGQRFTVRSDLMRHLNTTHSTLKPYDCDLCGKKFVTSDALRYHRTKIHSTALHFCEFCGKRYKWKGELRAHVQRNHMENKERFQCSLCSRNYADRKKLRLHMTTKHGVPKEVTYYEYKNDYQQEKAVPPYKGVDDQITPSGYEPQGSLLPPVVPPSTSHSSQPIHQPMSNPQDTIQTQAPIVTGPIYPHQHHGHQTIQHHNTVVINTHQSQQQQQQHIHHIPPSSLHSLHPQSHAQQHHHIASSTNVSNVYIVPDLIPLHEEQVSTTHLKNV